MISQMHYLANLPRLRLFSIQLRNGVDGTELASVVAVDKVSAMEQFAKMQSLGNLADLETHYNKPWQDIFVVYPLMP